MIMVTVKMVTVTVVVVVVVMVVDRQYGGFLNNLRMIQLVPQLSLPSISLLNAFPSPVPTSFLPFLPSFLQASYHASLHPSIPFPLILPILPFLSLPSALSLPLASYFSPSLPTSLFPFSPYPLPLSLSLFHTPGFQ